MDPKIKQKNVEDVNFKLGNEIIEISNSCNYVDITIFHTRSDQIVMLIKSILFSFQIIVIIVISDNLRNFLKI